MKRYILTLAVVAVGCETNETSMTITHVIVPTFDMMNMTCTLDPAGTPKAGPVVLDTGASLAVSVPFAVNNNLAPRTVDFSPTEIDQPVNTAAEITPLRFAARFECDTSAYSGARASGLILPRIDPQSSFCVDDRAEASASSFNSDVLPASGAAIKPGSAGVAVVRAIPHELGYAVDELFEIAKLADTCCRASAACSGSGGIPSCTQLQDIFANVDGTGGLVAVGSAGTTNPTLQKFADYAVYDGGYIAGVDSRYRGLSTPTFSMYMRGVLQGVTGYGVVVESNDYSLAMELCRNCGGGGAPKFEFPCIRE